MFVHPPFPLAVALTIRQKYRQTIVGELLIRVEDPGILEIERVRVQISI